MQLVARHHFAAPPHRVVSAMTDPSFVVTLTDITDVGSVEILDRGDRGSQRWLSARFTYGGSLDPLAARILGSDRPTWVQTYHFDPEGSGRLDIEPDHHGSLLHCSAQVAVAPTDGGANRSIDGALTIRVPLLGGRAEQALLPAILARIDAEADLLRRWLTEL